MNTRDFGKIGEKYAARYLEEHGYHIIAMNVYLAHCEIDIVAEDGTNLIFAEVKSRRQNPVRASAFGTPCESVDSRKQNCLIRAVGEYLAKNPTDKFVRIDVIEVYSDPSLEEFRPVAIEHLPNAVKRTGKFSRRKPMYFTEDADTE